jgi:hypothetical protein
MGTNTLQTRSAGETITADFFNDFNTALQTEFVGRNASGAATSGQGLGSSSVPWGTGYFNSIVLNGAALDATQITAPANRIVSGQSRSTSDQPSYVVANGSAATVSIKGNTTNLVFDVNGSSVTCSTDINITSLTTAPSSNNTCLVNDADAADQESTRYWGSMKNPYMPWAWEISDNDTLNAMEHKEVITVDNMGSEITGLVGKTAAFKINDGSNDEFFLAHVKSTTELTQCFRGFFLDENQNPVNRIKFANNDTITLMKLTWIFLQNDGTTTDVSYNNPVWSTTQPGSPATGDYWYDLTVSQWKRYSGSAFVTINRTLVGICIQDTSNCKAARSIDFFYDNQETNNILLEKKDATIIRAANYNSKVWVYSGNVNYSLHLPTWNITTDLAATATKEAYASESASTFYYLYITNTGATKISDIGPYMRPDLKGAYHPHATWRCVGVTFNDSSSNFYTTKGIAPLNETTNHFPNVYSKQFPNLVTPAVTAVWKGADAGGGSGSNQVFTCPLAVLEGNTTECGNASLGSSQVTVDAGTYIITAFFGMYANAHAKIYIYNATSSAYVSLSRSPMGYESSGSFQPRTENIVTVTARTAFEVRALNQNNASNGFSGGSFDASWDPGSNTNGVQRAYVVAKFVKIG